MLASLILVTFAAFAQSKKLDKYDCDRIQKCLDDGSKKCWGEFHSSAVQRGPGDLIALTMKVVPQKALVELAEEIENLYRPEFMQIDEKLESCLKLRGYTDDQFCANMRPVNHSVSETKKHDDPSDANACWENAVEACEKNYLVSDKLNRDLESCMAEKAYQVEDDQLVSLTRWETTIGHKVGATVMTRLGETDAVKTMISILLDASADAEDEE